MYHVRGPDLFTDILVNGLPSFGRPSIKTNKRGRHAGKPEQVIEYPLHLPVRDADFIAKISGRGLSKRPDGGVWNLIRPRSHDRPPAARTKSFFMHIFGNNGRWLDNDIFLDVLVERFLGP